MFRKHAWVWEGGEPRVFTVETEDEFPKGWDLEGARLLTVLYEGGGLGAVFDAIAVAAGLPRQSSFQALLEMLGDLSEQEKLIVHVGRADRLLADVGPALLSVTTSWERFARHAGGVHAMYLVLDIGPRAKVEAAFYPGGQVGWL